MFTGLKKKGAGYGYGSRTQIYKFYGYGSLVAHAQFTAVIKYDSAVSVKSMAIHTAKDLRNCEDVRLFSNLNPNLSLTQTFPRVQSHYLRRPPLFQRKCKLLHMRKHDTVSLDFGIMSMAVVPVDSSGKKKELVIKKKCLFLILGIGQAMGQVV